MDIRCGLNRHDVGDKLSSIDSGCKVNQIFLRTPGSKFGNAQDQGYRMSFCPDV